MRDDVVPEEVEIGAARELAAFGTTEQLAVEPARAIQIVHRE